MAMMEESSAFFDSIDELSFAAGRAVEEVYVSAMGHTMISRTEIGGRLVALKSLKPEYRGVPVYESLLRKEYELGKGLEHPSICRTLDFITLPQLGNCIELEWLEGETLEALLDGGAQLPKKKILLELCDALEYIHRRQIVHRDLKPSNVLITRNGQNVKLMDFGLSDADSATLFKQPAGTIVYASPEQKRGDVLDNRSDIWSLGVMMREMGVFPRVAARCTSLDRDRRYGGAADVRTAIDGRRRRRVWLLAAAVGVSISIALYALMPDIRVAVRNARIEKVFESVWTDIGKVAY